MVDFEVSDIDYDKYSNRQLAAIPLAVLALALLIIAAWYVMTGVPVDLGLAFTGGTEVRFTADDPALDAGWGEDQDLFSAARFAAMRHPRRD